MSSINFQNVEKTIVMLKEQLCSDLVNNMDNSNITSIVNTTLTSDKFFANIELDIGAIMADGKISISDIPRMLSLLLKTNTYFVSLKNSVSTEFKSVSINNILKYTSLSLFYYLMLNDNANQDDLNSFLLLYPSLWCLVEMSLPKHENEITSDNQPIDTLNKKQKASSKCC